MPAIGILSPDSAGDTILTNAFKSLVLSIANVVAILRTNGEFS